MKLDLIPWLIVAAASLMLIWVAHSYLDLRDEYSAYKAAVQQSRENALNAARAREEAHRQNLAAVKDDYEKRLSEINAVALRNYRRMRDDAATRDRITLSLAPGSVEVDAGAAEKCVVAVPAAGGVDDAVIAGCAEDALKLTAWQDWAKRNQLPTEETP